MIFGIGTDIIAISRIAHCYQQWTTRFPLRILAGSEQIQFSKTNNPIRFLSKHFAVKEAFAKALGTGFRQGVSFQDIELSANPLGKPELKCIGQAQYFLNLHAISKTHVSFSDERDYAVAFVILEV